MPDENAGAFDTLADLFPGVAWRSDAENRILFVNRNWIALTGGEFPDDGDLAWLDLVHPEDVPLVSRAFDEASSTLSDLNVRFRLSRADGGHTPVALRGRPLPAGKSGRFLGFVGDCVEERSADAGRDSRSRADDINHRVKNVLFSVQALARQTIWGTPALEEAYRRFSARLIAMANTHDLLIEEDWRSVSISSVVRRVAEPYGREGKDFDISGPDVMLAPEMSLSLALCLHELFVSATRFGALADDQAGKVAVNWTRSGPASEPMIRMRWNETGGASPGLPADLQRLGTALIQIMGRPEEPGRGDAEDGGGDDPEAGEAARGLTCLIEFPGTPTRKDAS